MSGAVRWVLIASHALVSLTAIAGGVVLALSAIDPGLESTWKPPSDYLVGSPFSSYLIPGVVLIVFLGGLQGMAGLMQLRRSGAADLVSAGAGLVMLVWIFVQMMYIPFSILQAFYFAVALIQVAAVILDSDVLARAGRPRTRRAGG